MALYTEACTVIKTDAGLSDSFYVKVDLHQGSVRIPLLFAIFMVVVSSEARSGLPSELLYADDLVLMAPTMEQLGRCVAEWRASLLVPYLRTYPMTSGGRKGAITDLLTTSRHPFRSFDTLRDSAVRRQVQSLILSSHRFLCPPLLDKRTECECRKV